MKKIYTYLVSTFLWITAGTATIIAAIPLLTVIQLRPAYKCHSWFKYFLKFIYVACFTPVRRIFEEKLDKKQAYLFVANHTSFFDVPLMGAYVPVFVNAVEGHSHFKWFLYRSIIKAYGQIPINRDNIRESLKSFKEVEKRLKNGRSIIIFPEGHRTKDGKIQEFKKLPFLTAKRVNVPLVMIGVKGMWKLSPNDGFIKHPSKITMNFSKPMMPEEIEKYSAEELTEIAYSKIKKMIE